MADKKKETIGNSSRGVRLQNALWASLDEAASEEKRKLNNLIALVLDNYIMKRKAKKNA